MQMKPQTVAEKIISRHAGHPVAAGDLVIVDVDGVMASDTTGPLAIVAFEKMGGLKPWDPNKIFLVIDHASPAPNQRIANLHSLMRDFAAKHGIHLYDTGEGICHQLMVENGHVKPGDLFIGADSHTCTYGSLGAFSTGVGSTDLAAIMLTGQTWLKVPGTIRVDITGTLAENVSAKDLILAIVGRIGMAGATYQAIEFHGEAIRELDLESRMTIANMAIEMGAKVGLINPQGLIRPEETDLSLLLPDEGAHYTQTIQVDADKLVPQISRPHSPDNVCDASQVIGTKINYGFIGSCVNGRLTDLERAAEILKGKRVAPGVRLIIAPASRNVFLEATRKGLVEILTEAGATFLPSGCGPCVGTHNGVPGNDETVISTANRNFPGRMGNPAAKIYLASPALVAASVIIGEIADPGDQDA